MWNSAKIADLTGGELLGSADTLFQGWVIDSRKAAPGVVFVALRGENTDGHRYIRNAFAAGAAIVLAETRGIEEQGIEPADIPEAKALIAVPDCLQALQKLALAWRDELNPLVIGITGSNGKTTTKDMVSAVLSWKYQVHKNAENHNNELGMPLTILNAPQGTEVLVLEMGMRGLKQIEALCRIAKPLAGVITNIGTTHLELLGSREKIAEAKWELILSLPKEGLAVLNADDFYSVTKAKSSKATPDLRVMFYGIEGKFTQPDIQARQLEACHGFYTRFEVTAAGQKETVLLPLPGEHNVLDALAALAVGVAYGVPLREAGKALENLSLSKMRLEVLPGIRGSTIINDSYNANPVSMKASLQVLAERGGGKTIAVLGDMYELGPAEVSGHQEVGKTLAALGIQELVAVGGLARHIAEGAGESGYSAEKIHVCADIEQAMPEIHRLLEKYGSGTWILVKGSRGMKMERISEELRAEQP